MPDEKDPLADLTSALQKKLDSEGVPLDAEDIADGYRKNPLGARSTVAPSRRSAAAAARRTEKVTNLDRIVKATLEDKLPIYFYFPNLSKAHSLRSMISSYLTFEIRSRIQTRIGRPTVDDSLVVVGVFSILNSPKRWLEKALEEMEKDDD